MNRGLLNTIDQDFCAILWIDKESFNKDSKYFKEMDYLTNGLLSQSKYLEGLFQTKNFGNDLTIGLLKKSDQDQITNTAKPILNNIQTTSKQNKVLIIHREGDKNLSDKFKKSFTKFEFLEYKNTNEE